jgi:hypothetical protein
MEMSMMEKNAVAFARPIFPREDATFKQRSALFNMYSALKWDLKSIRRMSKQEASVAIDNAKAAMENPKCAAGCGSSVAFPGNICGECACEDDGE